VSLSTPATITLNACRGGGVDGLAAVVAKDERGRLGRGRKSDKTTHGAPRAARVL
jgi:hypothetical protein